MKISLLLFSILLMVIGVVFTLTILGALIGIPLVLVGFIIFLVSFIWPIRL